MYIDGRYLSLVYIQQLEKVLGVLLSVRFPSRLHTYGNGIFQLYKRKSEGFDIFSLQAWFRFMLRQVSKGNQFNAFVQCPRRNKIGSKCCWSVADVFTYPDVFFTEFSFVYGRYWKMIPSRRNREEKKMTTIIIWCNIVFVVDADYYT